MSELLHSQQQQIKQQPHKRKYKKIKRRKLGEKGETESESYQPDLPPIKKHLLPIKEKKASSGSWILEENRIYLSFMLDNKIDFETEKNRRRTKVFYRLSKILKQRTPDQCRSHHQKLQIKYEDNLDRILEAVRLKIAEQAANKPQDDANCKQKDECSIKQTLATADANDQDEKFSVWVVVDFNELLAW